MLLLWTLQAGRRGRGTDELQYIESSYSIPGVVLHSRVLGSGFLLVPASKDIAAFRRMYGFASEGCCRTLQPGRRRGKPIELQSIKSSKEQSCCCSNVGASCDYLEEIIAEDIVAFGRTSL